MLAAKAKGLMEVLGIQISGSQAVEDKACQKAVEVVAFYYRDFSDTWWWNRTVSRLTLQDEVVTFFESEGKNLGDQALIWYDNRVVK